MTPGVHILGHPRGRRVLGADLDPHHLRIPQYLDRPALLGDPRDPDGGRHRGRLRIVGMPHALPAGGLPGGGCEPLNPEAIPIPYRIVPRLAASGLKQNVADLVDLQLFGEYSNFLAVTWMTCSL